MVVQSFFLSNYFSYFIFGFAVLYAAIVYLLYHRIKTDHPELKEKVTWKEFNYILIFNRIHFNHDPPLQEKIESVRKFMIIFFILIGLIFIKLLYESYSYIQISSVSKYTFYVLILSILAYMLAFYYRHKHLKNIIDNKFPKKSA